MQSTVQRRGVICPALTDNDEFVRRRFVVQRSIGVFEAMIMEASQADAAL